MVMMIVVNMAKYKPKYFVMSVKVEDAYKYYYGKLYELAYKCARVGKGRLLLIGGAGCTVGKLWIDNGGELFDVVEPSDKLHNTVHTRTTAGDSNRA